MRHSGFNLPARNLPTDRGQTFLFTAILLPTLILFSLAAITVAIMVVDQQAAQVAADAAALAGANDLPCSGSCTAATITGDANTYAGNNGFTNGAKGVTTVVNWPPTNTSACPTKSHAGDSNSVQVCITQNVSALPLGMLKAVTGSTITVRAVATNNATNTPPCDLCVLSSNAPGALTMNGNPSLTVTNGGIVVDSSSSTAGVFNGNASVSATGIGFVGNYSSNGNGKLSPTPSTGVSPVTDPLASVPVPAISGPNQGSVKVNGNGNKTLDPGIYTDITLNGNGTVTLNSGLYVITGSLSISGNPTIKGSGVTLYFTCSGYSSANPSPCNGSAGAGLVLNGNAIYQLTAPTSGTYQGLTIFYDRGNTAALTLNGNPGDNFTGTIYAKSAQVTLNGNPGITQLNSLIVANTVLLNGNGGISLTFNQSQNYPVSSSGGDPNLTE